MKYLKAYWCWIKQQDDGRYLSDKPNLFWCVAHVFWHIAVLLALLTFVVAFGFFVGAKGFEAIAIGVVCAFAMGAGFLMGSYIIYLTFAMIYYVIPGIIVGAIEFVAEIKEIADTDEDCK